MNRLIAIVTPLFACLVVAIPLHAGVLTIEGRDAKTGQDVLHSCPDPQNPGKMIKFILIHTVSPKSQSDVSREIKFKASATPQEGIVTGLRWNFGGAVATPSSLDAGEDEWMNEVTVKFSPAALDQITTVTCGVEHKMDDGQFCANKSNVVSRILLVPIEICRAIGQGENTTWVKSSNFNIARWDNAYENEMVNGYATVLENFIDGDPERFAVRIPLNAPADKFAVTLSTVDTYTVAGSATLDNATPITMTNQNGVLISDPQILVADEGDDAYAEKGAGVDEQVGDRTHFTELTSRIELTVAYDGGNASPPIACASIPAPERIKLLDVNPIILKINGDPVCTPQYVASDLLRSRQRFAQANVMVDFATIQYVDSPSNINIGNGVSMNLGEDTAILDLGTPHTEDFELFYVNNMEDLVLTVPGGPPIIKKLAGWGYSQRYQSMVNSMSGIVYHGPGLVAHETAHCIGKLSHEFFQQNVMYENVNWEITGVRAVKRFTPEQVANIRGDSHVKAP